MTSRDGTIGAEIITQRDLAANRERRSRRKNAQPPEVQSTELRRLRGLDPEWRAAVLDARLLGAMVVVPGRADGGQRAAATLHCAKSGRGTTSPQFDKLVTIQAPTDGELEAQVRCVLSYADLRGERVAEIGAQTQDLLSFFGMVDRLDTTRAPLTLELVALAMRAATYAVQAMKFEFDCPRPCEFSSIIQPMLATPTHSGLPSGHAAQAYAVAMVLSRLIDEHIADQALGSERFRTAARIAINRTVAGVHFPVDSAAGAVLGIAIGEWIAAMGGEEGAIPARTFKSGAYVSESGAFLSKGGDFDDVILAALYRSDALLPEGEPVSPEVDTLLEALWAEARAEWR